MSPKKSVKKHRDNQSAFLLSVDLNSLHYKDLCAILEKTENTVFKLLNGNLKPCDLSMLKLFYALYGAKLIIPRELSRIRSSISRSQVMWARKNKSDRDAPKFFGEKIEPNKFKYRGDLLNITELSKASSRSKSMISKWAKTIDVGDDITALLDKKRKPGRKPAGYTETRHDDAKD